MRHSASPRRRAHDAIRLWTALLAVAVALLAWAALSPTAPAARGDPPAAPQPDQDAFFNVSQRDLVITAGAFPSADDRSDWRRYQLAPAMAPYVHLDGPGEAYFIEADPQVRDFGGMALANRTLFARAPAGRDVSGRIYTPKNDLSGMAQIAFKVPAAAADRANRENFFRAKGRYYERLLDRNLPGAAWFRHQAQLAHGAIGGTARDLPANRPVGRPEQFEDTFDLVTGGRALSENLQLDRAMRLNLGSPDRTVPIADLKGIDVKEMDWKPLIKDAKPELDPLARLIPADQHAIFFPTFAAFTAVTDEADAQGTPVVQLLEPRAEEWDVKGRYQRQLALSLTGLGRLLGPQVISSVAITGSDPYLRVGSDIAMIFEAKDLGALEKLIAMQVGMMRQANPAATAVEGEVGGVPYRGAASPDRTVCSYRATLGNAVVVANSLALLEKIAGVHAGKTPALATAPEYTFFRTRYQRGDADETAFLILTDAAIRRWCGPKWRIADSRRTRAAAVMLGHQAQAMEALAARTAALRALPASDIDLGTFELTPSGVRSSVYGTLDFMTPINELDIDRVTAAEADGYRRWRDSYQQNWSQFFDPIAVRLAVRPDRLAADLTVMPLIARTDYAEFMEISRGVKLSPANTDFHGALVHFALAVNKEARQVKQLADLGRPLEREAKLDLLGWVGQSFSVYADDDPFWADLAKADDPQKFAEKNLYRLPVAAAVDVSNPFKLAAFLTAVRGFVDNTAPNLVTWSPVKYKETAYTKIAPTPASRERMIGQEQDKLALYYASLPDQLVLSFSEPLIQRAIDRSQERAARRAKPEAAADKQPDQPAADKPATPPLLGSSVALQVDRRFAETALRLFADQYQAQLQLRAWGNIPILNEWKRLFPDQDPVKLHQQFWQARLVCPGGGAYVWNDQYKTMESTVYGHPGQPKTGPAFPPAIQNVTTANFGLDFEPNGLRAKAVIERK